MLPVFCFFLILGPKTVFFWAPMFKWVSDSKHPNQVLLAHINVISSPLQGLVVAGFADMTRPAEKLSTSQSAVLTATGKMRLLNRYYLA